MCLELPTYQRLDSEQKDVYDMDLNGPFIVEGPPGTGKSVVALHRAAKFARNNEAATVLMFNRLLLHWTNAALDLALTAAKCSVAQRRLINVSTSETWFKSWYQATFDAPPPMRRSPAKLKSKKPAKYDGRCSVCGEAIRRDVDLIVTFPSKPRPIPVHEQCIDELCLREGYTGPDWGPALLQHAGPRLESALQKHGKRLNLIIDEGQDLSNNFYLVVSPFCASITVYADEAQIVSDEKSLPDDIAEIIKVEVSDRKRLGTNYRNRREVADLSAKFRPKRDVAATAQPTPCSEQPVIIGLKSVDGLEQHLRTLRANFKQKSIGVFFKRNYGKEGRDQFAMRFRDDSWAHIYKDYRSEVELCAPGMLIANTQVAKGLEFDIVVLADLQNWPQEPSGRDDGQLYVLLSRSRDMLQIAYVGADEPLLLQNPTYSHRFAGITRKEQR
jgi:hypothetical protein